MQAAKGLPHPVTTMFGGVFALVFAILARPDYRFIYNASPSVARGWYVVRSARSVPVGALVVVRLPDAVSRLADERQYLPAMVPALKYVAAGPTDWVCEADGVVRINGVVVARVRTRDGAGRVLVPWSGCRILSPSEVFLLNPASQVSFDSRYFGPVDRSAITGTAFPIWTW